MRSTLASRFPQGWPTEPRARTDVHYLPVGLEESATVGRDCIISKWASLYDCQIGDEVFVGPFTQLERGVTVGDRSRIMSHSFICAGSRIEKEVFIGHGVLLCNISDPKAVDADGVPLERGDRIIEPPWIEQGARIGSGAIIMPMVRIGMDARVGAGAVVTRDVEAGTVVAGVPARVR